jgi:hypothetical protein
VEGQITEDEFERMRAIEEEMAEADKAETMIDETRNELEAELFALEEAEKIATEIRGWYDENEFDRLPIEEYKTRRDRLAAVGQPVAARRRRRTTAIEKTDTDKQRIGVIEKAIKDDSQHADDPERTEIEMELERITAEINAYAAREPYDETPFDTDALARAVEDAATRQVQLKAKPIRIEAVEDQKRADPLGNKLFACGADDDWEPDRPQSRRSSENDENELRRRLSMEDINDNGSDPWAQFFGGGRRCPRYPQRGNVEPGSSVQRLAEAEAVRRAEVQRQNERRRLEAERREREEAERQRRSARWGQPWGASGWESADPFSRPPAQHWPDAAETQRRRVEAEQRRHAEMEQLRRRQQQAQGDDAWGRGLGGQWGNNPWGSTWNDAFF